MEHPSLRPPSLGDLFGPPEADIGRRVPVFALALTVLLVGIVPVVVLAAHVSVLVVVAVAGLVYAVAVVVTRNVFAGLCGAVFVLVTFAANVPVIDLTVGGDSYTSPQLDFFLVDVVAVPLAGLELRWLYSGRFSVSFGRERVVGYALAGFVGWSLLSALVANGPSRPAALFYVVDQLRYLLLFGVTAIAVKRVGLDNTVSSVAIAVCGQLVYASAEILARAPFGLTRLGDGVGGPAHPFSVGPFVFESALYPGGFVGTSRVFVALVVLFAPYAVWVLVRRSVPWKLVAGLALAAGVFLVRVSNGDTAWMALLLTTVLAALAVCACWLATDRRTGSTSDHALGVAGALGAAAFSVFLFSQRTLKGESGSEGGTTSAMGDSGSSLESGSSAASDTFVRLINHVPFVSTANVSVRFQQYLAAIDIGFQYPLFGLGGLNFPLVATSYGLPRPIAIHNLYLSVLAATGIPGLILLLVALVGMLVVIGKTALSADVDRLRWSLLGCGVLGFYAYLFWVEVYGSVAAFIFWVLAGAVVGAISSRDRTDPAERALTG